MVRPDYIPANYDRIGVVGSLRDLCKIPFGPANCILYPRSLTADFNGLALYLKERVLEQAPGINLSGHMEHISTYSPLLTGIAEKDMTPEIKEAAAVIIADRETVRKEGFNSTGLRLMWNNSVGLADTFHEDGRFFHPERGRILCAYVGKTTEGLKESDAIITPEVITPKPGSVPFHFNTGDVIRFAGDGVIARHIGQKVPAFIHRGVPDTLRLLLAAETRRP